MQDPSSAPTPGPRLATSSSVDSFLSWIAAPNTDKPSKPRKYKSNQRPDTAPSPPKTNSPPIKPDSRPRASSSEPSTGNSGSAGGTFILADANRLRLLSRSPLEEMGLPLFGGGASSSASQPKKTKKTKKHSDAKTDVRT